MMVARWAGLRVLSVLVVVVAAEVVAGLAESFAVGDTAIGPLALVVLSWSWAILCCHEAASRAADEMRASRGVDS